MRVFILNWNPQKWDMPDGFVDSAIATTESGGEVAEPWSVGSRTGGISWGDRGYLLRQNDNRGIVATGYFTSEVYQDAHWDGTDRLANCADLQWTTWLPVEDRIPTPTLLSVVPAMPWNRLQGSGVEVPPDSATVLDQLWQAHLFGIGRDLPTSPDEVPASETYKEGATKRVLVNRYERDPRAREACIAHHGTSCLACGFDFEAVYGPHGGGFIHVHHTRPLSQLPLGYEVDPKADLVPLCPNCHAMVHRHAATLSVADLRAMLR